MNTAYVTTVCHGDGYVPGVEALGMSLQASGAKHPLVVMVTPDVTEEGRQRLTAAGWQLREVEYIANPTPAEGQLFARFAHVFTKLRAWELIEFDKVVLLDADTIVLQNIDELFDRPYFAAAPDFFLPDRFNSGVMVLDPSEEIFKSMMDALFTGGTYDGGDQGFLNTFIPNWYAMPVEHRLPSGFNLHHFIYQFLRGHPSLTKSLDKEARILHYTMQKPWLASATLTGGSDAWWQMYFAAHPEDAKDWRNRLHKLEDRSFDRIIAALLG